MEITTKHVKTSFMERVFRTIWPRSNNEVFVIDGKWVIVFHIVIVALLVWFHFKAASLHDF